MGSRTVSSERWRGRGSRAPKRLLASVGDERLAEEISGGNEAAFEIVYERHGRALLSFCRHMLGSPEEAEEALQHSFAAAWSDLQRSDRTALPRLRPWLYVIARNRCLSLLRARQPEALGLDAAPPMAGFADEVAQRADLRALLGDLRELPEEQRAALVLSELSGLSHADIGVVLGREEARVRALVFRARSTLIDWREARETGCAEIREQLAVLRGGALTRRSLRRHLDGCPGCRDFRNHVKEQRKLLILILPVGPSVGLKGAVLSAAGIGGGAAAGGAAMGGATTAGLGATMLAPAGAATVAAVTVVGILAGGGLPGDDNVRASEKPTPRAQLPAASPTKGRAPHDDRSQHPLTRVGIGTADPARRAGQPLSAPGPEAGTKPEAGDPTLGTRQEPSLTTDQEPSPTTGQGTSQTTVHKPSQATAPEPSQPAPPEPSQPTPAEPSQPTGQEASPATVPSQANPKAVEADLEAAEKIVKARSEGDEKIAKAQEEAAEKIAQAEQEAAEKIAQADQEAAEKGPEGQSEGNEKKAKARAEADEKIAKARAEADEKIAKARAEADEKIAKARTEAEEKKANA